MHHLPQRYRCFLRFSVLYLAYAKMPCYATKGMKKSWLLSYVIQIHNDIFHYFSILSLQYHIRLSFSLSNLQQRLLKELVIANRNSCQTTYCNPIRGKTEPQMAVACYLSSTTSSFSETCITQCSRKIKMDYKSVGYIRLNMYWVILYLFSFG